MSSPTPRRRRPTPAWVEEIQALKDEIRAIRAEQSRPVSFNVASADPATNTFSIEVPSETGQIVPLEGLEAPPQFLPEAGQVARFNKSGPQLVYQPTVIAENAITNREIAAATIQQEQLAFDLGDIAGTTVWYGAGTPNPADVKIGDLWVKSLGQVNGAEQHETRRWNGTAWALLANQAATQALLDAAAAASAAAAANQKGIDALVAAGNAQTTANTGVSDAAAANSLATQAKNAADSKITVYRQSAAPTGGTYKVNGDLWIDSDDGKLYVTTTTTGNWILSDDQRIATALTTAQGKTTVFAQTSAPSTTGRTNGDIWLDTDDGNRRYVWNGSWTASPIGAAAISANARELGAITIYRQATAPASGMITGDYWIDSDDNKPYYYNGTAWIVSQDAEINTAITNAATAQATADGKMRIFPQSSAPTGLTTGDTGDMWIDTDDGNKTYTWAFVPGTPGQAFVAAVPARTNLSTNPSFETDAAGAITTITGWTSYTNGTVGTVTRTIDTTSHVHGTKSAKAVSSSMSATSNTQIGLRQTFTAVPGDVFRISGTVWVAVADTNKPVRVFVEWLDSGGAVLGSGNTQGTGSTGNQLLSYTSAALPANTASVRVTWSRRSNGTGSALTNADFSMDAVLVEKNVATGTPTTFIVGSDPGSAEVPFIAATSDSNQWVPRQFGNNAIQPNSLVASNVIATGTITAALFEAIMVLATVIIAGNPNGEHVRIDSQGLGAYADDPVDGVPNLISLFGRNSGGRNPTTGEVTWIIDNNGNASFRSASVTDELSIAGTPISDSLRRAAKGLIAYFLDGKVISNIVLQFGVNETPFLAEGNRNYRIRVNCWTSNTETNGEAWLRLYATTDGSRPTTSSTLLTQRWVESGPSGRWKSYEFEHLYQTAAGAPATQVRLLLTVTRSDGQTTGSISTPVSSQIFVYDAGVRTSPSGTDTNDGTVGGTSTPAKTRREEYYWGTWAQNFQGGGTTIRTDTTDLVQGLDPSGFNGDGSSMIGFQDLTGVLSGADISEMWLWLYAYHFYYDTGEVILGTHAQSAAPSTFSGGARWRYPWSRAEGKWINVTEWAGEFQNGTTRGFTLGASQSGDFFYYGRILGVSDPNHADLRPRVWIAYYK